MPPTLIMAVLAVVVIETVLNLTWAPVYFRYGLPLFRWEVRVAAAGAKLPDPEGVSGSLDHGLLPRLVFRSLGGSEYGFRESMYLP